MSVSDRLTDLQTKQLREINENLLELNNRLSADLAEARELLKETTDALETAFCFEGVPTDQLMSEIHDGRWNGVRAHIEINREFLDSTQTR